ncbi:MAG: LapA family protein [Rhodobacteraceae bacterium]|nr:LapA family protein [Paracoccaceae bacterium]
MRYLRLIFLAVLALALLVLALANRAPVTLVLLPDDLARLTGVQGAITVPLFAVVFGGIAAGLVIGFVWEWLREHRFRAEAARAGRLKREVDRLRKTPEHRDDVLALLEDGGGAR